jgi:hypothetical protein
VLEYVVLGDFQTAVAFLLASAPEASVRLRARPACNPASARLPWCSATHHTLTHLATSPPSHTTSHHLAPPHQVRYYRDVVCTVVLAASATRSNKASPPSLLHIQVCGAWAALRPRSLPPACSTARRLRPPAARPLPACGPATPAQSSPAAPPPLPPPGCQGGVCAHGQRGRQPAGRAAALLRRPLCRGRHHSAGGGCGGVGGCGGLWVCAGLVQPGRGPK